MRTLKTRNWLIAADKLRLGYRKVVALGWLVGGGEKGPDPSKIDGLTKLQPPRNTTLLKSFLGAVGWYRDLIPHFGLIAAPLYKLLKKDTQWSWDAAH